MFKFFPMKRHLLLVVLVLFSTNYGKSQNWNLIKKGERHYFQKMGDTIPLCTIFNDSFKMEGNDTLFFLNRFFLPCDTCSKDGLYLDNQPGFLQREWLQMSNGVAILQNPDTFFIQVSSTVNDEWWFDARKTIKATTVSKTLESVFDQTDSVLTISVNGENTIKISKNFGLLKFFEYSLTGLENAGKGKYLLTFNQIYDFQVGDVYMYSENYFDPENNSDALYKWKILKAEKIVDTLSYTIDVKYRSNNYPYEGECWQKEIVKNYIKSPNQLANFYHDQKLSAGTYIGEFLNEEIFKGTYEPYEIAYGFSCFAVFNDKISKIIGFEWHYNDSVGPLSQIEPGIFSYVDEGQDFISHRWFYVYQQGLGFVRRDFGCFEQEYSSSMIGYIKEGVTIGTVYSDEFMTAIEETSTSELIIYPNPCSYKLNIMEGDVAGSIVSIYNMDGKLLKTIELNSNTISISDLNEGFYLMKIKTKNLVDTQKFMIKR